MNENFIKCQTLASLYLIIEGQLKGDEQNLLCKIFKFTLKKSVLGFLLVLHVMSVKMFVTQGC